MSLIAGRTLAAAVAASFLTIAAAQAQQTTRTSSCQWERSPGGWQQTCTSAAAPAPEAPFKRGAPSETTVRYEPVAAEQKQQPAGAVSSDFCRPPYHMTERDGCQRR